jgi:DNA-binding response OmpR family regulator
VNRERDAFAQSPEGALVSNGSAAAGRQGRLKSGDGCASSQQPIVARDLPAMLSVAKPGDKVVLDVWRDGKIVQIGASLGDASAKPQRAEREVAASADSSSRLGLALRPLEPVEKRQTGIAAGLVIEDASGAAANAGVQAGDVLLSINGRAVTSVEQVRDMVGKASKSVALLIQRGVTESSFQSDRVTADSSISMEEKEAMRLLLVEDDVIGEVVSTCSGPSTTPSTGSGRRMADTALVQSQATTWCSTWPARKDGLEVLRAMRARKDRTPVLVATARDSVGQRIAGLDAGADDYILKPYDLDEMLARIRALLRRSAGRAEPVFEYKSISINPATREVMVDGAPASLSAREWAVLEALIARPGVLSRPAGSSTAGATNQQRSGSQYPRLAQNSAAS